jgi:hypothetical protein
MNRTFPHIANQDWDKIKARFWAQVLLTDGCWLWLGKTGKKGYAQFSIYGVKVYVHRVAYKIANGQMPDDLDIDHLCRVHNCVNPAHLEAVPHKDNIIRGIGPELARQKNLAKRECVRGHPFSDQNTKYDLQGRRYCRECHRIAAKIHYDKYEAACLRSDNA